MRVAVVSAPAGRIVLGTAQLGRPYGIANRRGQPPPAETAAMLELAVRAGVGAFDTAPGYGDAELRIGRFLREYMPGRRFDVVTKLAADDVADTASLRTAVARARARLGVVPAAVLLHDPDLLSGWRGALGEALRACRGAGEVDAIGVSVYHPKQFAKALEMPGLDVIQAPFSVLDRRLEQAGLLELARRRQVRVMLRSVFLQGLLLLEPGECPAALAFAAPRLRRWRELCSRFEVAPAVAALRFVLQRTALTTVVVGCESRAQLQALLDAAAAPELPRELLAELAELASSDARLLDPTRWRALIPRP
jgi:aryl-alcohol dehydrogenase-like predicted oxidoreductase